MSWYGYEDDGAKLAPGRPKCPTVAEVATANKRERERIKEQRERGERGRATVGAEDTGQVSTWEGATEQTEVKREGSPSEYATYLDGEPKGSTKRDEKRQWGYGVKRPALDIDRLLLVHATQGTKGSTIHQRPDKVKGAFNTQAWMLVNKARAHKSGNCLDHNAPLKMLVQIFGEEIRAIIFPRGKRSERVRHHKNRGGDQRKRHLR